MNEPDQILSSEVRELIHRDILLPEVARWRHDHHHHWLRFTGESMKPALREGDQLLAGFGESSINIGDIVVITAENRLIVHRIIDRRESEGYEFFTELGDHGVEATEIERERIAARILRVNRDGRNIDLSSKQMVRAGRRIAVIQRCFRKLVGAAASIPIATGLIRRGRNMIFRLHL